MGDNRLAALAAAGDERAFEALYDRHHRPLLGFCRHMLRSHDEAEDALQQTFLRAHRALAARGAPAEIRPWLFTIARNCCLTMLSARRPVADGEAEPASTEGLGEQVQVRADLRAVVADVERLPDDQRAALVLAELADLSHDQIAEVIGVRPGKVKALIHQARTTLIAEREARETPCESVREELSTARGGALRRGPLRRHLRVCAGCRTYREAVGQQRRALALALPVTPSLGLKAGILGASASGGAGAAAVGGASGAASLGGSLAAKLVAGAIVVGGGTAGGVAAVDHSGPAPARAPAAAHAAPPAALAPALDRAAPTARLSPVVPRTEKGRPATSRSGSKAAKRAKKRSGRRVARGRAERARGHGPKRQKLARKIGTQRPAAKAKNRPAAVGGPPGVVKRTAPVTVTPAPLRPATIPAPARETAPRAQPKPLGSTKPARVPTVRPDRLKPAKG